MTRTLAVVALAVLLSGCLQKGSDGSTANPAEGAGALEGPGHLDANATALENLTADPLPRLATMYTCSARTGAILVPSADVADAMPPGFSPAPLGPPPGDLALVAVQTLSCGNWTLDGAEQGAFNLMAIIVRALAPEEFRREGVQDFDYYVGSFFAQGDEMAALLEAWGAGTAGTVRMSATGNVPGPFVVQDDGSAEGITAALTAVADVVPANTCPTGFSSCDPHIVRYFSVRDGAVSAVMDWTMHSGPDDGFADGASLVRVSGWHFETGGQPGFGQLQYWDPGTPALSMELVNLTVAADATAA